MAAIDTLTAFVNIEVQVQARRDVVGLTNDISITETKSRKQEYTAANPNSSLGGADEVAMFRTVIAASGSATINLQAFTNVVNEASSSFARLKGFVIQLLDSTDDSTVADASSITIGNAIADRHNLNLIDTDQMQVFQGGAIGYTDRRDGGFTVSGTIKDVLIANDDGTNAATVLTTFIGGTT